MKIKVYTNIVEGGWSHNDLETGIGGSEEKLIEWAKEIAKEHDLIIYMNGVHGDFDNIKYRDHREFKPWEPHDVFISFKFSPILRQSINAKKIIHWTTEIEPEWPLFQLEQIDRISCLSAYHKSRMLPRDEKFQVDYLWADINRLERNKVEKETGTMLYCSSFDRGLEELLKRWEEIKEKLGVNKLYITYGWEFIDKVIKGSPHMQTWKQQMIKLCMQDGIEFVGRLSNDDVCKMYWKSEYWCLPLNNADSELFCINAIKAQYCESKPVVRKWGALTETVNTFIDWDKLVKGEITKVDVKANKQHAKKFNLKDAIKEWKRLLQI